MATIVIDGDASGAVKAAQLARRAYAALSGTVEDLDQKFSKAGGSERSFADRLTDIDKAAQIAGGPLASFTPRLNDFADAIEQVGVRSAVANVATAALASGGLAVFVAGATAAVTITAALAANAVSVAANIGDFDAQLGANSVTMQRNRAEIEGLRDAQDALSISTAAARVELAGLASPVLTEVTYALAGFAGMVQDATVAADDGSSAIGFLGRTAASQIGVFDGLIRVTDVLWQSTRLLAEAGRENAEALREQAAGAAMYRVVSSDLEAEAASIEEAWGRLPFDMVADSMDRVRTSVLATTPAVSNHSTAVQRTAVDYSFLADSAREAAEGVAAASQAMSDRDAEAIGAAAVPTGAVGAIDPLAGFGAVADEAAGAAFESAAESSATMRDEIVGNFQSISEAAIELHGMVVQAMSAMFEGSTKASLKERKKQFAAMKAAALLEAGINTALAVTNAFATAPNPIVGAVLAALVGAVGAVQIGLIAAKQPNFHRGGLLPDERQGPGYVTRSNERTGIFTAQGVAAFGGESGLQRFMDAVNSGRPMRNEGPGDMTLVIDGVAARTRRFAAPNPGYGQRGR